MQCFKSNYFTKTVFLVRLMSDRLEYADFVQFLDRFSNIFFIGERSDSGSSPNVQVSVLEYFLCVFAI